MKLQQAVHSPVDGQPFRIGLVRDRDDLERRVAWSDIQLRFVRAIEADVVRVGLQCAHRACQHAHVGVSIGTTRQAQDKTNPD